MGRLKPRLVLRRGDGRTYLTRWGFSTRWGGVFVHRMDSGDPGIDLHDHPWPFVSLILRGGYTELTWSVYSASLRARWALDWATRTFVTPCAQETYARIKRGEARRYPPGRLNVMGLGRAHRIVYCQPGTFTLVVHGPRRRDRRAERADWGFYTTSGWVDEFTYDKVYRDRDLVAEFKGTRP